MANLPEVSQWEAGVYRVEKTDDVLGDDSSTISGPINQQSQQLGNRTKYLKDQLDAHSAASDPHSQYLKTSNLDALLGSIAISGLPLPTIETSDNKMPVVAASAVDGGTVSVASGSYLSLCREIVAGLSGRSELHETPDFTSADLDVSTTYFLRAQLDSSGVLEIYTTKGSDSDSIPASKKGTVNGANGGGFDSTVFDCLIARVTTGLAGSSPAVTALINRKNLIHSVTQDQVMDGTSGWEDLDPINLNWARKPSQAIISLSKFKNVAGGAWNDFNATNSNTIYKAAVDLKSSNRYSVQGRASWEDSPNFPGQIEATWLIQDIS